MALDIIMGMVTMETVTVMVTKEVMEALDLMLIVEMLMALVISSRPIKEIIREVEEEATGIRMLEMVDLTIADHLETLSLNGMSLSQLVKSVSEQATLLIFAGNLKNLLHLELIDHHQTEIQSLHIWLI